MTFLRDHFGFLEHYGKLLLVGAGNTLLLAAITVLLGSIIGVVLAVMRLSMSRILRGIALAYIEFIRGTPLLVQILLVYFSLSMAFGFQPIVCAAIALIINSSAYVAEIVRSGIQAVDKGQTEAARSLGLSGWKSMRHIILPQAIRNILPALGNEFVTVIKESSISQVIGANELMYNGRSIYSVNYRNIEVLVIISIVYFIMTFTTSRILRYLERRMRADEHAARAIRHTRGPFTRSRA